MISIIAVVGKNRAIGRDNRLLWNLPEDMNRFRLFTKGKTVIMGDKTFLSIGQPLKNRKNVVVTLDRSFVARGVEVVYNLEALLKKCQKSKEEIFVIGGGTIYRLALPYAKRLYLTVVDDAPKADTFFPDYSEFEKVIEKSQGQDNGFDYQFLILERMKINNKKVKATL